MSRRLSKSARGAVVALLATQAINGVKGSPTALNSTQGLPSLPSSYGNSTQAVTGLPPCDALISAGLSHIVYLPDAEIYPSLVDMYWAQNTRRSPYCFAMPSTTNELIQTLAALGSTGRTADDIPIDGAGDWHIAVRSGGHGSDYSNNIDDGVTIDLSQFNATTYNKETNLASVETGARWQAVYEELEKHGVHVTGGRNGVVGVGGFLLGGGNSCSVFDAFNAIPALIPAAQHSVTLSEAAVTAHLPPTLNVGAVMSFANDPKVLKYSLEQHDAMVADLKSLLGADGFTTLVDYQPFSSYFSDISIKKGGNVLGLERNKRKKWLWVVGITLTSAKAEKKDGEEFIYLNYAHANHDVLGSYGKTDVEFMKKVAEKYDPHGFFQTRIPGGFKISRVDRDA